MRDVSSKELSEGDLIGAFESSKFSGGIHAEKYMLGANTRDVSMKELSGCGLTGTVESSKFSDSLYQDGMNKAKVAASGGGGGGGGYSLEEVAKHTSGTDCWVVVNGEVLDVTSFLADHPGGELSILRVAGINATLEFNMI